MTYFGWGLFFVEKATYYKFHNFFNGPQFSKYVMIDIPCDKNIFNMCFFWRITWMILSRFPSPKDNKPGDQPSWLGQKLPPQAHAWPTSSPTWGPKHQSSEQTHVQEKQLGKQ